MLQFEKHMAAGLRFCDAMAGIELAKGKQRAKWKEEFERQLDATEAAVVERDHTIARLKAEVKELKKGVLFNTFSVYVH